MGDTRVGLGFDVHPFSDDPTRTLVLGGVHLPGERGLAGHSDADVVAHAVADALLGACGLGDLGEVDASQHQRVGGVVGEGMDVEAEADPHVTQGRFAR